MKKWAMALGMAALPFLAFGIGVLGGKVIVALTLHNPPPQHAVCLQSHREVVLIRTICGEHDVCQKPVVTEICDRVEAPPPRPLCQGNQDD